MPGPDALPAPQGVAFRLSEEAEDRGIADALGLDIATRFGPRNERPFSIVARDPTGARAGGVNGVSHWGWMYVRHLFVEASWRGRGLGLALMGRVETLARDRGCTGIYLDTFDPMAVDFYGRLGFTPTGEIPGFPPGHRRTWMSKPLAG